jgi:hypothetical protein
MMVVTLTPLELTLILVVFISATSVLGFTLAIWSIM